MTKRLIFILLTLVVNFSFAQTINKLEIKVDPRIELLSIIQYIGERTPSPTPSNYVKAVDIWFGNYKSHPAVEKLQEFMTNENLDPAFPAFAIHLSDFPDIEYSMPLSYDDSVDYDALYGIQNIKDYFKSAKNFAIETDFLTFYNNHKGEYEKWSGDLKTYLSETESIDRFEDFFQTKRNWTIYLVPLIPGGAHACSGSGDFYRNNIAFTLNYQYKEDYSKENTPPNFTLRPKSYYEDIILWHEATHFMVSHLTYGKYRKRLLACSNLYEHSKKTIKKNFGYDNWLYTVDESIVFAIGSYLKSKYINEKSGNLETLLFAHKGMIYNDKIVEQIKIYDINRKKYKNFETFFPKIIELIEDLSKENKPPKKVTWRQVERYSKSESPSDN